MMLADVKTKTRQQLIDLKQSISLQEAGKCRQRWTRLEVQLDTVNVLEWLSWQNESAKTYWRDRQGALEVAGIGEADVVKGDSVIDHSRLFLRLTRFLRQAPKRARYYGGISFNRQNSTEKAWKHFGAYRFVIPQFELMTEQGACYFACNLIYENNTLLTQKIDAALEVLDQIQFAPLELPAEALSPVSRENFPDRNGWHDVIDAALNMFSSKGLQKIVLARKAIFEFSRNLNPIEFLRRLQDGKWGTYFFCFQPLSGSAFVGNTPERLFIRKDDLLMSEAIAGTRPRGTTAASDRFLEAELLNNEKDQREHRYVVDAVRSALQQVCSIVDEGAPLSVVKLPFLQHLYASVKGVLQKDVDEGHIMNCLHPTPAVGGYPRDSALNNISSLEPFDRGWYAGPVGWVGEDEAEFAVAIRSGLIDRNKLYLYSGAGIVSGSTADSEWDEIESKISSFLSMFQQTAE